MSDPSPFYQQLDLNNQVETRTPNVPKTASIDQKDLEYIYSDLERLVDQIRLDTPNALSLAEDVRDAVYRLLR